MCRLFCKLKNDIPSRKSLLDLFMSFPELLEIKFKLSHAKNLQTKSEIIRANKIEEKIFPAHPTKCYRIQPACTVTSHTVLSINQLVDPRGAAVVCSPP